MAAQSFIALVDGHTHKPLHLVKANITTSLDGEVVMGDLYKEADSEVTMLAVRSKVAVANLDEVVKQAAGQ